MPAAPLARFDTPVATRGGRASTSAGAIRAGTLLQPMQLQPLQHLLRSHVKGLQWGRPAPRAAVRLMSRAARSAWGDRDDSPVSREARRVAQQAYNEAQREVAFAKRQLARAEEEARAQRGRISEYVERRGWGAVAAPALGAIVLASLFGPLIWGLLFTSVVAFGSIAFIGLLPAIIAGSLAFGVAAVGLGLFATATAVVLPSIFAMVAVGGGLALGSFLIRALTAPRAGAAAAPRRSRAAPAAAASAQAESSARRAEEDEEEEDLAAAAARELRRFDRELVERERRRQVEEGTRWTP